MLEQTYVSGDTSVKIAASIEAAIASGRVAAGEPLPPVRSVAAARRVSAATVAAAYRLLRDRGLVVADGRRGTRVRSAAAALTAEAALPAGVRDLASGNPDKDLLPPLEPRFFAPKQRLYGEDLHYARLIELATEDLARDGVKGSLAVVSGALDGIERVLREHVRAGDRVLVEDPCFTGVLDLLATLALTPVPVRVDDEGPVPESLRQALRRQAAALIVTPRAQNPTGAAITPRRQRTLRSILKLKPDLVVIEDDHAGPIAGAPYATLVGGHRASWAVVRSVSKSLGPDLRVAMVVADETTIARIERRQRTGIRWVSHLLQQLVASLWSDRKTARLLARAEQTYAARRDALLAALAKYAIPAHGQSGLNVWIPVPQEGSIVQGLLQRGWGVQAGERYRLDASPAIRVTIASLEPADAARFAADLAAILSPAGRSSWS